MTTRKQLEAAYKLAGKRRRPAVVQALASAPTAVAVAWLSGMDGPRRRMVEGLLEDAARAWPPAQQVAVLVALSGRNEVLRHQVKDAMAIATLVEVLERLRANELPELADFRPDIEDALIGRMGHPLAFGFWRERFECQATRVDAPELVARGRACITADDIAGLRDVLDALSETNRDVAGEARRYHSAQLRAWLDGLTRASMESDPRYQDWAPED